MKEKIKSATRNHTTSLQPDNVEDIGYIKNPLIIEAEVTKNNKKIRQLKYYSVYLLNGAKHILQDIHL